MSRPSVTVTEEVFPLAEVFTISRGSRSQARVVHVTLDDGTHQGHGEGVPYSRYHETVASVIETVRGLAGEIEQGLDREQLQTRLPPGAARNALDCAFWDLAAKRTGKPVWQLAGLEEPQPEITAYTLSLAEPARMREKARANAHRPLLKIKLGGEGDLERLEAVREGAPSARIIVDANEGWSTADYERLAPVLARLGVAMVEQPFPASDDSALAWLERTLPVCADESCHDRASLDQLAGRYDMINIKLDKTGGLTEALALREAARAVGYSIMVGCMVGSSLSMAPALLVAQGARVVDLDGPLLLAEDRPGGMQFDETGIHPADTALWG
ncbi:L-alanine-DL-glutamate epimerase-like enolase superfamily enzyme [Kushneria sinocarnis]|uniref:Dipeptide epimerase n=1 Tax=Kushneria sinocarnis TaxID=595502 RepID=A0A420WTP8_9GAMM|nr:N-acetyl-D-Glu racemase DgcA [Kushneria sinocarnis]RKQ96898.1 L-alanine-DL-glutamate epimerase-like enolase superfamily enzyme [Kushneria sinocarnis]